MGTDRNDPISDIARGDIVLGRLRQHANILRGGVDRLRHPAQCFGVIGDFRHLGAFGRQSLDGTAHQSHFTAHLLER